MDSPFGERLRPGRDSDAQISDVWRRGVLRVWCAQTADNPVISDILKGFSESGRCTNMTILPSAVVTSLAASQAAPTPAVRRADRDQAERRKIRRRERDEFVSSAPDVDSEEALRNLKGGADEEEREDAKRRQHYATPAPEAPAPRLDVAG